DRPIFHGFAFIKLDHSPEAIKLDRLRSSAPFLENHDPDRRLGRLRDPETDGHTLRVRARFSKRPYAQEIFDEVKDDLEAGDFTPTSAVFIVHKFDPQPEGEIDNYPVYRAALWEPVEGSVVSAPADLAAGIGRALDEGARAAHDPETCEVEDCAECAKAAPKEEERQIQPEPATVTSAASTTPKERTMQVQEEILKLGEMLDQTALAREFIAADKSLDEFKAEALKRMRENQPTVEPGQSPVDLTPEEKKRYSIGRAIMLAADGGDGFEREVSTEIGKKLKRTPQNNNSIFVPTGVTLYGGPEFKRTPLTTGGATTGADILFTEPGSFIDMLRARAKVFQLGATLLPGLTGAVAFPKQTGAGTLYWVGENPGSDVTESNIALDQVVLSPKTAMAQQAYSRQLLRQSAGVVDTLVTNDLRRTAALGLDRAALHGAGSSNEPTGIYVASGVNPVAFGGGITFPKVVEMETVIAESDADVGEMGYLTTPGVRGAAKTTQKFTGTNGAAVWEDNEMNGYRAEASTQVRSNMGAGTNEHGIAFGVWPELVVGEWGAMEILTDPYTLAGKGLIRLVLFLMADMALRHSEAFSKGTGLTVS
ncbi:MAG TPA: phage major capsid protein, partial [Pyrinomonadaceae bacterium]|nr:phage major capsid protein [Pyrinomonadaceae bacterium]